MYPYKYKYVIKYNAYSSQFYYLFIKSYKPLFFSKGWKLNAIFFLSSTICVYICTVEISACPRISCKTLKSAHPDNICVAKLCLKI